jgi:hypothetical protein
LLRRGKARVRREEIIMYRRLDITGKEEKPRLALKKSDFQALAVELL